MSTGDAGGSSGFTETLGAEINDQIRESTKLSGSSLSDSFADSGDIKKTYSVTNRLGNRAEVGLDIKNAISYSGNYELSPRTANYAQATMSLDVDTADSIYAFAIANNRKGLRTTSDVQITSGSLNGYTNAAYSNNAYVCSNQDAGQGIGHSVTFSSNAINREGDQTSVRIHVDEGTVETLHQESTATAKSSESIQTADDAYGNLAEINSHVQDKAKGYQLLLQEPIEIWVEKDMGEGYFAVQRVNNDPFGKTSVTSSADIKHVDISSEGFGENTALILDPRRWEFEEGHHLFGIGSIKIREPIMDSLKNKGYAVTYYSDSAVSFQKVFEMDEYKVSAITTHSGDSETLELSKSSDGRTADTVWANMLINNGDDKTGAWDKNNGMILLVGCNTFTDTSPGHLSDAASKASVSGGTTTYWSVDYGRKFLIDYFQNMADGKSASQANQLAAGDDIAYDINGDELPNAPKQRKQLTLLPYTLQFAVTSGYYSETADLDQAVKNELGDDYSVADWNDIKAYGDNVQEWADGIGMAHNDYYFVTRDGQGFWNVGNRHYFITRFDGTVDWNYLVHDQIGGNIITLGSWYGIQERVLAKSLQAGTFKL